METATQTLDVQTAPRTQDLKFSNGVSYQLHEMSATDYSDWLSSSYMTDHPEKSMGFDGGCYFCWISIRVRQQTGDFKPTLVEFKDSIPGREVEAKLAEVADFVKVPFPVSPEGTSTD